MIEAHVHTTLDNGLITFQVFRVRQADVLDVTAFTEVEALKFMILLFKRRNVFGHIQVERIREVLRAVVFMVFEFIFDSHFLAVIVILTGLRSTQAFCRRTVNGVKVPQLMFVPYNRANLIIVDTLDETERGSGGFGSTGV